MLVDGLSGRAGYSLKVGFASARSQAFAGEGGEGKDEVGEDFGFEGEDVEVEIKGLVGGDSESIEMAGAEDEGTGPVGKAAG